MASMRDAGLANNGNWLKADDLFLSGTEFDIVNAHKDTAVVKGKQIDVIVLEIIPLSGDDKNEHKTLSLGWNEVRARIVNYFKAFPEPEPLTSVHLDKVNTNSGQTAWAILDHENSGDMEADPFEQS